MLPANLINQGNIESRQPTGLPCFQEWVLWRPSRILVARLAENLGMRQPLSWWNENLGSAKSFTSVEISQRDSRHTGPATTSPTPPTSTAHHFPAYPVPRDYDHRQN